MDVKGWNLFLASGEESEWEHIDDVQVPQYSPPVQSGRGRCNATRSSCAVNSRHNVYNTHDTVRPLSSSELSFTDTHYADRDDRMFKSLELDRNDINGDCVDEQRQHRSLNGALEMHTHIASSRTVPAMKNGATSGKYDDYSDDDDDDDDADIQTVKNMFLSAWTNARNGWIVKTSTSFKHDSPIWLLGHSYVCKKADQSGKKKEKTSASMTSFDEFKLDFKSRLWFTYRTDLPTLPGSNLKSDMGWGCMLRCGQMLLAQAFIVHFLSRDWRWHANLDETWHRQIIQYFGDSSNDRSPFSIQKLIEIGHESGKKAGDWYGPASIAYALRSALSLCRLQDPEGPLAALSLYIARDGVVYFEDVYDECYGMSSSCNTDELPELTVSQSESTARTEDRWRSVIIVIPLRLGGDSINMDYVPYIKTLLNNQHCIGLIGGRPKHSLYFIGWQDDKLIYLDPHCCQEFVDVHAPNFPLQTFHCTSPRKLSFSKMDPSCAIAFYCQSRQELDGLLSEMKKVVSPSDTNKYPIFHTEPGRLADVEFSCDMTAIQTIKSNLVSKKGRDDFTLL